MKKTFKILIGLLVVFLAIQIIRPKEVYESIPLKDLTGLPKEVSDVLRNSCFDCHSSEVNLKWFDKITPANFLVSSHIKKARMAFNFTNWDSITKPQQDAAIFYALNNVLSGNMPLKSYTTLHPEAALDSSKISVLKNYALSISALKKDANSYKDAKTTILQKAYISNVENAPNGVPYILGYRNWKAISTTDRFDNGTVRIIYGNEIAVKAIQENKTNPWPDGTTFAKAAWKQQTLSDGSISTGDFVQVEFMVKDAKKYSKTSGWGWGRWKGSDLKPYGKTSSFDMECVQCHKPMEERDYVFTAPLYLKDLKSK